MLALGARLARAGGARRGLRGLAGGTPAPPGEERMVAAEVVEGGAYWGL